MNNKYSKLLLSDKWKIKRTLILKRDNFTCVKCGINNTILHVHHKVYFQGKMPWDIDNKYLETLCNKCHLFIHQTTKIKTIFNKPNTKNKAEKIKLKIIKMESSLSKKDFLLNERYKKHKP